MTNFGGNSHELEEPFLVGLDLQSSNLSFFLFPKKIWKLKFYGGSKKIQSCSETCLADFEKKSELILGINSSLSLFSPETKIWDSSWNKHSLFNFSLVDASRIERLADLQLAL